MDFGGPCLESGAGFTHCSPGLRTLWSGIAERQELEEEWMTRTSRFLQLCSDLQLIEWVADDSLARGHNRPPTSAVPLTLS